MKTFDTNNLICKISISLFVGMVVLSLLAVIDIHFVRAGQVTLGNKNGPFYCIVPLEGDVVSCGPVRYFIEFIFLFISHFWEGPHHFLSQGKFFQPAIAFCVAEVALLHQLVFPKEVIK